MIRIDEICEAMKNVVGWEQPLNPAKAIDENLTATESGLYFGDAHPLLTIDNIEAAMPETDKFQYPDWNQILPYKAGDRVTYKGIAWIANKDNQNEAPPYGDFNNDYSQDFHVATWRPYNVVSNYLERLTRKGIAAVIQTFLQMKQLEKETRNLLERKAFFDGAGRLADVIENRHRLAGFEIIPVRSMGVTAKIERVGLQFTGGNGEVTLYLFHSSQVSPVRTFKLDYTVKNGGFQWFTLKDCYLPYISDTTNAGGSWFLCYNQDELPHGMHAVNFARDWSREPCGTCNAGSVQVWRELTKFLQVSPFIMPAPTTFEQFPEMWDIAQTVYTNTRNYGLNVEFTVGCDLTDFFIAQRHIFATVIQRQVATIALRTMAMNPDVRVNRNQSNVSRMEFLYELDGNTMSPRPGGLAYDLKKAYEALRLDTQGLDRICLSCNNHGVIYGTV